MDGEGWVGKKREKIKWQEAVRGEEEGLKRDGEKGGKGPWGNPLFLLPPWPHPTPPSLDSGAASTTVTSPLFWAALAAGRSPPLSLPSLITPRCTRTQSMLEPGLWDQLGNTPTCLPRHAFHYSPPSIFSLFLTIRKSGFFFSHHRITTTLFINALPFFFFLILTLGRTYQCCILIVNWKTKF